MTQYFTIAGITWRVLLPEGAEPVRGDLADYETPEAQSWDHTLEIVLCADLPQPRGTLVFREPDKQIFVDSSTQQRYTGSVEWDLTHASQCITRQGDHSLVRLVLPENCAGITAKAVLNAMEAEHHIARRGGFLLHSAWAAWRGKAILFTAPSGTGKSTQAELWCRLRGAELINGDRAAVLVEDDSIHVRGIPFCGCSGVGKNAAMPLGAVVYLSQAPENTVTALTGIRAFRRIWEGCCVNLWDRQDVDCCAAAVTAVAERVRVYHLACTPDERAVRALEQRLEGFW
jgi:hypothetical protein